MKEILQKTREERVKSFISRYKFLSNSKYYKTNKVSSAAWDSWAAQGKAGGCYVCNVKHYNYSIKNKRYTTTKGGKGHNWSFQDIGKGICSKCYEEVERQCSFKFIKY